MKVFALKSIDGSVGQLSETREALEKMCQDPMIGLMTEIVEIEYNDTPLTEVGEATKAKLMEHCFNGERRLKNFHASWGPKFYEMSADERMQLMYDIMTDVDRGEPISFNDSNRPQSNRPKTDVRALCSSLQD